MKGAWQQSPNRVQGWDLVQPLPRGCEKATMGPL